MTYRNDPRVPRSYPMTKDDGGRAFARLLGIVVALAVVTGVILLAGNIYSGTRTANNSGAISTTAKAPVAPSTTGSAH